MVPGEGGPLNTYFVNSLGQTVYRRPDFSRSSPLKDYEFSARAASVATALAQR